MFGQDDSPLCDLHGAESNGMLRFCGKLIRRHQARLPSAAIYSAGCDSLLKLLDLIEEHPF
eukprot:14258485-Alexandrium_andersonii.AAC.1